jgi:hypothetical protein
LDIDEDNRFVCAPPRGRMLYLDGSRQAITVVHTGNTSKSAAADRAKLARLEQWRRAGRDG